MLSTLCQRLTWAPDTLPAVATPHPVTSFQAQSWSCPSQPETVLSGSEQPVGSVTVTLGKPPPAKKRKEAGRGKERREGGRRKRGWEKEAWEGGWKAVR